MRKIFLENLPKKKWNGKICVDWTNSVGYSVHFIYEDIDDYLIIKEYIKGENPKIIIEFNDREIEIPISTFHKCAIGKLLNKISSDFKIEIGQIFKDNKRDLVIIDREKRIDKSNKNYNRKYYKYKCLKCKNEDWIIETALLKQKQGCNVCGLSPNKIKLGFNTIYDKEKWMIPYVGEDCAKLYSPNSTKKIKPICPICKNKSDKYMTINSLYRNKYICNLCSDGISYPNKFMYNLLKQLKENKIIEEFDVEKRFEWCKFENPYRNKECFGIYDFYITSMNLIIEMDGGFHYKERKLSNNSIDENIYLDCIKDKLAKEHNLNVVRINCDYNINTERFNYIKNSIENSELNSLFNLNLIEWSKIEEKCENTIVKDVCEFWNKYNYKYTTKDISNKFNINNTSIREYLKKGTKLGFCDYDSKHKKYIKIYKNKILLSIVNMQFLEIEKISKDMFGEKLRADDISETLRGLKPQYKGYTFEYATKEEYEKYIKEQENKVSQY